MDDPYILLDLTASCMYGSYFDHRIINYNSSSSRQKREKELNRGVERMRSYLTIALISWLICYQNESTTVCALGIPSLSAIRSHRIITMRHLSPDSFVNSIKTMSNPTGSLLSSISGRITRKQRKAALSTTLLLAGAVTPSSSSTNSSESSSEASGGGSSTMPKSIFNLVKSIVGAGVLSLPSVRILNVHHIYLSLSSRRVNMSLFYIFIHV